MEAGAGVTDLIYDGGWFKVYFTAWLNQGLGVLYAPNLNLIGITFIIWAIIIRWEIEWVESEDDAPNIVGQEV